MVRRHDEQRPPVRCGEVERHRYRRIERLHLAQDPRWVAFVAAPVDGAAKEAEQLSFRGRGRQQFALPLHELVPRALQLFDQIAAAVVPGVLGQIVRPARAQQHLHITRRVVGGLLQRDLPVVVAARRVRGPDTGRGVGQVHRAQDARGLARGLGAFPGGLHRHERLGVRGIVRVRHHRDRAVARLSAGGQRRPCRRRIGDLSQGVVRRREAGRRI